MNSADCYKVAEEPKAQNGLNLILLVLGQIPLSSQAHGTACCVNFGGDVKDG